MAAEKKDIIKPFRLTQQEADRLKKQAQESGMKESEYIKSGGHLEDHVVQPFHFMNGK